MEKTQKQLERDALLISLGFEFDSFTNKWSHKMFDEAMFDFRCADPDLFWTMHTIFKTCEFAGEIKKASEIRSCLHINS